MGVALRLRDHAVHRQHVLFHRLRQVQVILHDVRDAVKAGVVMVAVSMVMVMRVIVVMVMMMVVYGLGFLHAVDLHGHVGAADAAAQDALAAVDHVGDADGVQLRQGLLPVRHQLQQGRRQHIACRAHGAVQIQCFHQDTSV